MVAVRRTLIPWKPGDGFPRKTCWFGEFDSRFVDTSKYENHSKIALRVANSDINRRRAELDYNYAEVKVHDNVNLENPGELAWVANATGCIYGVLCVFHTEREAKLCAESWGRMMRHENLSSDEDMPADPAVYSVRVEYSIDEIDAEEEGDKKRERAQRAAR